MGSIVGGMVALWVLFLVAEIVLVIWALTSVARSNLDGVMKLVWVAVILFFPILGSIAALIFNRAPSLSS